MLSHDASQIDRGLDAMDCEDLREKFPCNAVSPIIRHAPLILMQHSPQNRRWMGNVGWGCILAARTGLLTKQTV